MVVLKRVVEVQGYLVLESRLNLSIRTLLSLLSLAACSLVEALTRLPSLRHHLLLPRLRHAQARLRQRQVLPLPHRLPSNLNLTILSLYHRRFPSFAQLLRPIQLAYPVGQVEAILSPLGAPNELLELEDIRLHRVVGGRVDVQVELVEGVEHPEGLVGH